MNNEIAILMAAGKGERLRPVTSKTPKPMVKVNGTSMIETVIAGLERRGIKKIYLVVGYLKEAFNDLPKKYPNITIVENKEFTYKNNISSIHAVADFMGENDCFICEADLVASDLSIFDTKLEKSCYFGKLIKGHSDDWGFGLDKDGRLNRIGKGVDDGYLMCGVSFFKKDDAKIIANAIKEAYNHEGHENLFWDEVCAQQLNNIDMRINPVRDDQIVEIDTYKELCAIDPSYINFEEK